MFGNDDLASAYAALAQLEESGIFLGTLTIESWRGPAADAARDAQLQHSVSLSAVEEDVRTLIHLLQRREELRSLLSGAGL